MSCSSELTLLSHNIMPQFILLPGKRASRLPPSARCQIPIFISQIYGLERALTQSYTALVRCQTASHKVNGLVLKTWDGFLATSIGFFPKRLHGCILCFPPSVFNALHKAPLVKFKSVLSASAILFNLKLISLYLSHFLFSPVLCCISPPPPA